MKKYKDKFLKCLFIYAKKFLWLLLIIVTLPLLSYGLNVTLGALLGIPYEVFMVICIALYVVVISKIKINNQEKKQLYIEQEATPNSKLKIILKSIDLRSEVIVFLVLLTPLMIKTLLNQNSDSVFEFIFLLLCTLVGMGLLYGLLSFITLFIVYSKWDKKI